MRWESGDRVKALYRAYRSEHRGYGGRNGGSSVESRGGGRGRLSSVLLGNRVLHRVCRGTGAMED